MPVAVFTIGTGQVQVAARNKSRTSLTLANASAALTAYFKDGKGVSSTSGIPIPPNGSASLRIPEDDPTLDYWVAYSGAGGDLRVIEGFGRNPVPVRVV